MKKLIYIIVSLALLAVTIVWLKRNKDEAEKIVYHYDKDQQILVETDTLARQIVELAREYTGSFESDRETRISADIQGRITRFYVEEGDIVRKGMPLVKLDDELLRHQLQAAEVQIAGLRADEKRYSILVASDAIPGVQLEKTQFALQSAIVQRNTILEQIRKTSILAPFHGVVTLKMSEIGAFAAPGVPLLELADIQRLRFNIQVPEYDLPLFEPGVEFEVTADQYPEVVLGGKMVLTGSKGNSANLFPVQFSVKNTEQQSIKAGMFGKLKLKSKIAREGILIPASAIVGSDLEPRVYVADHGKAILKPIVISRRIDNRVLVLSGLQPGEILITGGFINLYDQAPVRINEKQQQ